MNDGHGHIPDELLLRYVDGELPGGFEAHLDSCSECRARVADMRGISDAIEDYAASLADWRPNGGKRQALLAAIANNARPRQAPAAPHWRTGAVLALTAAAVLILGLALRPARTPPRTIVAQVAADPATAGFIALPYSDESLSTEGSVVLEVEVPRSARLLAGMPAGDGRSNERVKAEVMVGADGLVRAIRFLD